MSIAVLGSGAWGSALASVIKENNKDVTLWGRDDPFPKADILVIAVPTQAIREVLAKKDPSENPIIVNCSKGIESKTNKLPIEVVFEILGNNIRYFSLMGPSFSKEVMDKMPTLVNLASLLPKGKLPSGQESDSEVVQKLFQTDFFRVRVTGGLLAIELAAALKNFYAVACGIAKGLEFGENTRAKLIAIAIEEAYRLADGLSFQIDDYATAGMIGDFLLTCNSMQSRNFRFGNLLVEKGVEGALAEIKATVEGYNTSASIPHFMKKAEVELPLAEFILDALRLEGKEQLKDRFMQFSKQV